MSIASLPWQRGHAGPDRQAPGPLPLAGQDAITFSLFEGAQAVEWAAHGANKAEWDSLFAECRWATAFQSASFFNVWARHYALVWRPLLVVGRRADGVIAGIMPLAMREGLIVGVGGHQAEYHGWISRERDAGEFVVGVLDAVGAAYPVHRMRLLYLPYMVPRSALAALAERNRRVTLHHHLCHELKIDRREIQKVLKKKSNRSKLHRLQRLGRLEFRLLEPAVVAAEIDQIIAMCDLRHGALNNVCPFTDDPVKRAFHVDWLRQCPEDLRIGAALLNGRIAAVLIFVKSGGDLHLAIAAHDPRLSEHSPNKLNMYESALMLGEEGASSVDLTPGGDTWKARFSTGERDVVELIMHESEQHAARVKVWTAAKAAVRRGLAVFGGTAPALKRLARVLDATLSGIRNRLVRPAASEELYEGAPPRTVRAADDRVLIDPVQRLIEFGPTLSGRGRQAFLSDTLSRLESGQRCYAVVGDGGLACLGWMSQPAPAHQTPGIVQSRALIDGLCLASDADSAAPRRMLERMLADISAACGDTGVFIRVPRSQTKLKEVIASLGFAPAARHRDACAQPSRTTRPRS